MRMENVTDPVYEPNTYGGPQADPERYPEHAVWEEDIEIVRSAYTLRGGRRLRAGQDVVREVLDDEAGHGSSTTSSATPETRA